MPGDMPRARSGSLPAWWWTSGPAQPAARKWRRPIWRRAAAAAAACVLGAGLWWLVWHGAAGRAAETAVRAVAEWDWEAGWWLQWTGLTGSPDAAVQVMCHVTPPST